MKASEIRNLSVQELNEKLSDLKSELFNLRFQHALGIDVLQGLGAALGPIAEIQREKDGKEHRHPQKGI